MLDLIRKKQKSQVIKFVFWFIIATFVGTIFLVWGQGGSKAANANLAAVVNGDQITRQTFEAAYSNLYRFYQSIYQERFTPEFEQQLGLRDQALDMLIERALLAQEADRRDIRVTRKEVVDSIAGMSQFQENGAFSKDRYIAVLNIQRLTPETFEEEQRLDLRLSKLREAIRDEVTLTDEDVEQAFREQNETVSLAFLRFRPDDFAAQVKVTDDRLSAYFEANREDYRQPEKVALSYLKFAASAYLDTVEPTTEDLERFYRRHLDRFEIQERVRAAHILVQVDAGSDEATRAARRERAETVLAKARAGEDFAKLARTYSDDPGSARKGGDLGLFGRGVMVKPFELAAFTQEVGTIGEIVETDFGFHIIRVDEHIEAGVKPLDAVIEEVRQGAAAELAKRAAFEKAMDAYNLNRKEGGLAGAAAMFDLTPVETSLFTRVDPIDGLGHQPEIATTAFALETGKLARPVQLDGDTYLFTVREREPSSIPALDDVRQAVASDFRSQEAKSLADSAAAEALQSLRDGEALDQIARRHGLKIEKTGPFARTSAPVVPSIGAAEELAEAAFTLTSDQPLPATTFPVGDDVIVASLAERQEADLSELDDARRAQIRETELASRQDEHLRDVIQQLREQAELQILITADRGQS